MKAPGHERPSLTTGPFYAKRGVLLNSNRRTVQNNALECKWGHFVSSLRIYNAEWLICKKNPPYPDEIIRRRRPHADNDVIRNEKSFEIKLDVRFKLIEQESEADFSLVID